MAEFIGADCRTRRIRHGVTRSELHQFLGGDFEITSLGRGNFLLTKSGSVERNEIASVLAGRYVHGPAIFCKEGEVHANCGIRPQE